METKTTDLGQRALRGKPEEGERMGGALPKTSKALAR